MACEKGCESFASADGNWRSQSAAVPFTTMIGASGQAEIARLTESV